MKHNEIFKIYIPKQKAEFAVIGLVDLGHQTVMFQGLLNGIPFTENADYQKIRARVLKAVDMNSNNDRGN